MLLYLEVPSNRTLLQVPQRAPCGERCSFLDPAYTYLSSPRSVFQSSQ